MDNRLELAPKTTKDMVDNKVEHTPIITKDIIVLLDIDKTLVVYKEYTPSEQLMYTGGHATWKDSLAYFKSAAAKAGVRVHYGLATFKPKSFTPNLTGDVIYGRLMADQDWIKHTGCHYSNNDISEFINPKLIFFLGERLKELSTHITDIHKNELLIDARPPAYKPTIVAGDTIYFADEFYQCKAIYAMAKAVKVIEAEYHTTVPTHNVYLIDDVPEVCHGCTQLGYSSICVHTIAKASEHHQQQVINLIFRNLLLDQVTREGTPKDVHDNLMAANKAVLEILQTPKGVIKTLKILEDEEPLKQTTSEPINLHRFFSQTAETEEEKSTPVVSPSPVPSLTKTV
jgi:hypothetical protein